MKKILLACLFCLYLSGSHAQTSFHKSTTLPRVGDKISKQEIRYLPPGESGTGKVWQFDRLTPVDEQYEPEFWIIFSYPPFRNFAYSFMTRHYNLAILYKLSI